MKNGGMKGKGYVDDGIDDNNDDDDDINDKGENPAAKLKAQINKVNIVTTEETSAVDHYW